MHGIRRYDSKAALLVEVAHGRNVLHLGAVGETLGSPRERASMAPKSVHALLTSVAEACVGVDIDADAVEAIRAAGIFDNIIVANAALVRRDEIALPTIDVVVASDVIEHLADPGALLTNAYALAEPQTRLVVTTPNAAALPQTLRYARGRVIDGDDHRVSFNIYSLRNLLTYAGWEIEWAATCYQRNAPELLGIAFKFAEFALRRIPSFGGTLFTVARRSAPVDA